MMRSPATLMRRMAPMMLIGPRECRAFALVSMPPAEIPSALWLAVEEDDVAAGAVAAAVEMATAAAAAAASDVEGEGEGAESGYDGEGAEEGSSAGGGRGGGSLSSGSFIPPYKSSSVPAAVRS